MANTRPIRHAFRKRFRPRRRAWPMVTGFIDGGPASITTDGTTSIVTLVDPANFDSAVDVAFNAAVKIHRLVLKATVVPALDSTTFAAAPMEFVAAIAVFDDDDSDTNLFPLTTDNIFQEKQVLKWWWDYSTWVEVPGASYATVRERNINLFCDLKFRRPISLRPKQTIDLVMEFGGTLVAVAPSAQISGIVRVAVQPAGVGR